MNRSKSVVEQSPHYMVKIILIGTVVVSSELLLLLLASWVISQSSLTLIRMILASLVLIYLLLCALLLKAHNRQLAGWMLILLYGLIAIYALLSWGINAPVGVLILGFVIFLPGVLLGSRYIIPVALAATGSLIGIHIVDMSSLYTPDYAALSLEPGMGDIVTYVTIFGIFALISWLSGRQMERNLKRALSAEIELENEKALLSIRLAEQTKTLRQAQQEEIMQLYQFAELGQLTTVILHDLANNLSILSLDIDDISEEHKTSEAILRTKESIGYLEAMVSKVRRQLSRATHTQKFDVMPIIRQTIKDLSPKAERMGIKINHINKMSPFFIVGDPLRLSQIFTILINNAIDASMHGDTLKQITVATKLIDSILIVSVIDYGVGIDESIRASLFEPLQSTKQNGLGIGLFVAKQIAEMHFKGNLVLGKDRGHTEFIVKLPKAA